MVNFLKIGHPQALGLLSEAEKVDVITFNATMRACEVQKTCGMMGWDVTRATPAQRAVKHRDHGESTTTK